MEMIWHDYEGIQCNPWTDPCRPQPLLAGDVSIVAKVHGIIDNVSEETVVAICADCDEVRVRLCVVVSREADGLAMGYCTG